MVRKKNGMRQESSSKIWVADPGPVEHPLQYVFWLLQEDSKLSYQLKKPWAEYQTISIYASMEQLRRLYSHMVCPGDLSGTVTSISSKKEWNPRGRLMQIKMLIRGVFHKGAWPPVAGRISFRPCWRNSSWLGRRSVGLWSLSISRTVLFQYGITLPVSKQPQPESVMCLSRCLSLLPNTIMDYKAHQQHQNPRQAWVPKSLFSKPPEATLSMTWPSPSLDGTIIEGGVTSLVLLACSLEDPSVLNKRNWKSIWCFKNGVTHI